MPRGCSIAFYTESMKNMFTADMKAIIGGTYTGSVQSEVGEFKTCPNYTLHEDPLSLQECQQLLLGRNDPNLALMMWGTPAAFTLVQIFAHFEKQNVRAQLIWSACRYTTLKDAGGKTVGVNAAQGTFGDRDSLGRLAPTGGNIPDRYYFNPSLANRVKPLT